MTSYRSIVICLLALFSASFAFAQRVTPADSIIQMSRWESEDSFSTIDVCSPHLVLFEGIPYEFELYNGAFSFPAGRRTIPYRYDEFRNQLTLIFPEGPPLVYHPVLSSVYQRRLTDQRVYNGRALYGRFCHREFRPVMDGPGEYSTKAIAFWSNGEFDFSTGAVYASVGTGGSPALGMAVLCGDAVIMSFNDGQAAEAQVIERNSNGEVTRIKYANEEYAQGECEVVGEPPIIDLPAPPPPPPPVPPGGPIDHDPQPAPQPTPDPPRPAPRPRGPTRDTGGSTSTTPQTGRPSGDRPSGNTQSSGNQGAGGSAGGSAQTGGGRR